MMDVTFRDQLYRLIESRKSIRKYKRLEVPQDALERILGASLHAPSGKNRQNWRFFVVRGAKRDAYLSLSQKSWLGIKDVLYQKLKPSLYSFTERFFFTLGDAPVIIFCYSVNDSEEHPLTSMGSVYMAVENLELAALAEGLGTCTMGAPLEIKDEVNEFLNIRSISLPLGATMELLCAVTVGFPDHEPPKAARQLEGRIAWLT
jgi:nitroreductase